MKSQTQFRIVKEINGKSGKLHVKWKAYDNPFNS